MRKHKAKATFIENGVRWEFPEINVCRGESVVLQRRGDVMWVWKRGRFITALFHFKSWLKELVRERRT